MATRLQLVLLFVLSGVTIGRATTFYWIGKGSTTTWNTGVNLNVANWSLSSNGSAVPGGTVIGSADDVIFDGAGGSNANCSINATPSIKSLTINGYTGTLGQIAGLLLVSGNMNMVTGNYTTNKSLSVMGNFSQAGGIFTGTYLGASAPITLGSFSQTGGTFISTSDVMMITGNAAFNVSGFGTFNPNNGTINFRTISDTGGDITITCAPSTTLNDIIISVKGAYSAYHTISNDLIANNVKFDLLTTSNNGPGKVRFYINPSGSLTVNGTLSFSGDMEHYLSGGTIYAKGDIKLDATATPAQIPSPPATLLIMGDVDQLLRSTVVKKINPLFNVTIAKPSGNLTLDGIITVVGPNWTWISGNIIPGNSTVCFYQPLGYGPSGGASITVAGTHALGNVEVDLASNPNTLKVVNDLTVDNLKLNTPTTTTNLNINLNAGSNLTVNKVLDFLGSRSIVLNGGTINAKGDINLSATYTALNAGNTSTFTINGSSDQTIVGNISLGACVLPNMTIDKTGGTVTFKNTISVQGDWTYVNGSVDATSNFSTVYMNSTYVSGVNRTLDGQGTTTTMSFYNLQLQNNYISVLLAGALDVDGALIIEGIGGTQITTLNSTSPTSANNPINLGGNLSCNGAIISNNSIVTLDGSLDQDFNSTSAMTIKTLVVNKPVGKMNLLAPLSIETSGQLQLIKGLIIVPTSGSNTLTLKNSATTFPSLGSAVSYIDGPLNFEMGLSGTRTHYLPLGVASVNAWSPSELTVQHSTSATFTYTAQIKTGNANFLGYTVPAPLKYLSGIRYLQVTADVPSTIFTQGTIKLYFGPDDEVNDLTYLKVALAKAGSSSANPATWGDISGGAKTGTGTPYMTGTITSAPFSQLTGSSFNNIFVLATDASSPNGVNPLPIEISSFTVDAKLNDAFLQWTTEVEMNNDYFIVERAIESNPFLPIGQVKGAGSTKSVNDYSWLDKSPPEGKVYYRLKQVDFDEKFVYSKVLAFRQQEGQKTPFVIYPLPVRNSTIYFNTRSSVRIVSATGQTLGTYENVEEVDVSHLTDGMYYVINQKGQANKMIIVK